MSNSPASSISANSAHSSTLSLNTVHKNSVFPSTVPTIPEVIGEERALVDDSGISSDATNPYESTRPQLSERKPVLAVKGILSSQTVAEGREGEENKEIDFSVGVVAPVVKPSKLFINKLANVFSQTIKITIKQMVINKKRCLFVLFGGNVNNNDII